MPYQYTHGDSRRAHGVFNKPFVGYTRHHAANKIAHAFRRYKRNGKMYGMFQRSKWRQKYNSSQYKKPNQSVYKGKTRRFQTKNLTMMLTDQRTPRKVNSITRSLCKAGVMEEKIKLIQSASTLCGFIGTNNTGLATMGGICYNFNQAINTADNTQASGFGAFQNLDVWRLQRSPANPALTPNSSLNNNTLEGRYMFCKYIKLQIDIQLTPNLITSVANLASLGAEYLCPCIFRVIILRKKPGSDRGGITPVAPAFGRDLFLSWSGPMNAIGLTTSSPESSEALVEPRQVLYKPVNLTRYQVLKDFKFSAAFPTITGSAFNTKNVGYKKLDLNIPINQKLEYNVGALAGSNALPNNCDCDYSMIIMSGLPGCNQANMLSASPTDPAIQPTHSGKWRASIQGKMVFVDS